MATPSPAAVVTSASHIPPASLEGLTLPPSDSICMNALIIPTTVPKKPSIGETATTEDKTPMPFSRFFTSSLACASMDSLDLFRSPFTITFACGEFFCLNMFMAVVKSPSSRYGLMLLISSSVFSLILL